MAHDETAIMHLEQSQTQTIGFGIFHFERNIGYGVLGSSTTIVSKLFLLFFVLDLQVQTWIVNRILLLNIVMMRYHVMNILML